MVGTAWWAVPITVVPCQRVMVTTTDRTSVVARISVLGDNSSGSVAEPDSSIYERTIPTPPWLMVRARVSFAGLLLTRTCSIPTVWGAATTR